MNKKILVTGASSGIGKATCERIYESGASVYGISRTIQDVCKTRWQTFAFDVVDFENYPRLFSRIEPVDGIVHCAGSPHLLPARNIKLKNFDPVLKAHLYAPILLTIEAIRSKKLNEKGSVVFVSSACTLKVQKSLMSYAIAKSGLHMAAQQLTAEFSGPFKMRFNCVLPGLTETPLTKATDQILGSDTAQALRAKYPLGTNEASDVAALILFLLSEESSKITASLFPIDGGLSAFES